MAQSSHAAKKIVPDESLNNYTYLTDSQVFICELSTGILGKLKVDAEGQRIFKSISKKKKKKKFRAQMKALRSELTRVSRGSSSYAKAKRKLRRKRQKKKEFLALYERCEKAADEDPAPGQDPSFVAFDITVTGTGVSPVTVQLEIVDEAPETNHSCIVDNYPDTVSVETVADCRILISPRIYLTEPVSISYHALRSDNESTRSNEATLTVTWQQQPRGDSERLAVKEIVRLSHPAYAMNNTFYGANNPLNVNETRMLMYELTNPKGDLEGGRLFVWGHIAGQGCESDAPCLTNWETKEEYEQAAKQVPALNNDFSKNRWMKLYWSPLETEENILYGLPRTANSIYRINVDTNIIEEVVSFDPQDGTDLSNPGCYGFTAWNSLWCSYVDEDWSKGGFEVDIVNRNVRFHNSGDIGTGNNLALHYCQEHPGENLPAEYFGYPTWFSHGHGALSKNHLYQAIGYGGNAGVWYLPTCTFIDDQTYQINYPHLLSWRHPNHVAWGNTQANYFFGDTPNSYYDSSQRAGHHTHPWLKPVSLFQIFFDEETGLFEHHHLTSFLTAGKWNEDAPETCDYSVHENCAYNWTESPLPWADSTGRKLFFTSTMGTYSHTDYHIKGVTPYGGAGVFVALLEPASNPDSCIDSDGDGFGPHCVAGPDCDDSNYFINPNAKEVFDGRDNNCNGQVDCEEDPSLVCSPKALFVDTDSLGGACSDVRERAESSYTTPFCTIQRASDMALPGDSIWIREGEYAESLDIDQGGTSETHRIVFRALPNELVVIRPGKRYGNPWGALGGGVYQKSFVGISQDIETLHAISYNGSGIVEVSNVEDLMNSEYAGGIDLLHIDYENKLVTLRLVSATPSQVYFVDESSSVTVRAPYVTFEDVRIEYAYRGLRVRSYGVFDDFSEHGHHFSMIHSEIAHTFAEAVHSSRDNLILRGNLFEYNGVRHKIKEGEVEREDNATALLLFGDNALVEENEVRETSTALNFRTSSVEPGYAVRGFIFRKNFFRARVVGSGKDNLFYNNLVYEPEQTGFSLYYQTENNRIYNNIFHSQYGVLLSRYGIGRDVHFKNNIVVGTIASRCLDLGDGDVSQYHLDHNIYDTCVLFSDTNGTISNTFSGYLDFISPYGQEAHSSMQDPMVVLNPDDRQPYTPLGGSPVIDNGEDFSSLFAEDYVGNGREQGTWDIGPYEFQ